MRIPKPSPEARRQMALVLLSVLLVELAYVGIVVSGILPRPFLLPVIYTSSLAFMIGCGSMFFYLGLTEGGRKRIRSHFLLHFEDLKIEDFIDRPDDELNDLIKRGLKIGALENTDLISRFVLKKAECLHLPRTSHSDAHSAVSRDDRPNEADLADQPGASTGQTEAA